MNNRYHIWANNPDWTDDPKTNRAGFIGYADTIDGVINAVSLRLKNKEEKAKPYYAVVTMGDMYSEYDPDDIVVLGTSLMQTQKNLCMNGKRNMKKN